MSLGNLAGAAFAIVGFAALLDRLGLARRAAQINAALRETAATVADRTLRDAQKERLLQRHSLLLFGQFATLTCGLAVALALPLLLVWVLDVSLHAWSFEGVMRTSLSPPFLAAGLLLFLVVLLRTWRRREG